MADRRMDDYVEVAERIQHFRAEYPTGSLRGDWRMHEVSGQWIVAYRAEAYRTPDDQAPGVGCAWELVPGRTNFTRGSELQNAETSAWGRAIIAVGASDAKRGIASREEVRNREAERPLGTQAYVPETRADGSMTEAEQVRTMNGRVPGSWRATSTAENDEFYDMPPAEPRDYDSPGTITPDQLKALHAKYAVAGIRTRPAQLAKTMEWLGLSALESHRDLSQRQGRDLLSRLEKETTVKA